MSNMTVKNSDMDVTVALPSDIANKGDITNPSVDGAGRRWYLSFRNSAFWLKKGSEEYKLPKEDIHVILLGVRPDISRQYFEGAFNPANPQPPVCTSLTGVRPDADCESPQSSVCARCPQNQKGSKVVNGKPSKACVFKRRAVGILANDNYVNPETGQAEMRVFQIDFASTTLFGNDGSSDGRKDLLNLPNYLGHLVQHGVTKTYSVVTQISFDQKYTTPRTMFKAVAYVKQHPKLVKRLTAALNNPEFAAIYDNIPPAEGDDPSEEE